MAFLYLLLIGRGSAINTGPLFAISLFPSLLISSVAWVAKRVALHETENNSNNNNLFTSSTENSSVNSSTSQSTSIQSTSINLSTSQFENVSTWNVWGTWNIPSKTIAETLVHTIIYTTIHFKITMCVSETETFSEFSKDHQIENSPILD